ncbi:DMT family transporter [Burkholderia sp. S171]|uniref:DMT family transporter n=1 Tax=Burkholderia sp. S171 TaxID=1641860 RepID=UPI00131DE1A5|nr:DMT family transporter [Burkholderia sp. S171]
MNALMFALTTVLWGAGALATTMQVGVTPAPWSVALRMGLAGIILLCYGAIKRIPLGIPGRHRIFVALQGILFFSLAFISFYESTRNISSGLAALMLSTSSIFAALIGRFFLGTPLPTSLFIGALFGITGVGIIVAPALENLQAGVAVGFAWALAAAIATAAGTVIGARNQKAQIPTVAILGWGAITGSVFSAAWAEISGTPFTFDLSVSYLGSLLYLAIAASCITFMLYFELVRRLGPGKAAYTLAGVPVVALTLSMLFEGLHPDTHIAIGAAAVIAGNIFVLRARENDKGHATFRSKKNATQGQKAL